MTRPALTGPVFDFDPSRTTNAQAIADLARLGIIGRRDTTLDLTVGPEAGFWKLWRPDHLVTNDFDRKVKANHHWDARRVPVESHSYDVVALDLPYANRGTGSGRGKWDDIDARFGTTEYRTQRAVERALVEGTAEACRISERIVLVKCQDASVSSRFAPQSFLIWDAARQAGARLMGEIYVHGVRKQPTGKKQINIWSAVSVLMVFRVGRRRRI